MKEEKKVLEVIAETEILGRTILMYDSIENPWFVASDIADWLGVKNVSQMLKQAGIQEDEKGIFLKYTLGGNQKSLFVTEDAMYEVLMTSRKKEAKELRKGIKAYLKSIRKTGAAIQPGREEEMVQKYFPSFSKEVQTEMVNDLIKQNKELKEFYDDLMNTEGLMSINTMAKRTWSNWSLAHELTFIDIKGNEKTIKYQYRDNGKRVQVRSGVLKAGSSCYDEDEFSLSSGLVLAEMRLVVKYLDNQVKSIAKSM